MNQFSVTTPSPTQQIPGAHTQLEYTRSCERVSLNAYYSAVPWACPESVSIDLDFDNIRDITTAAISELVVALAGVPAAARARHDFDPTASRS